ncbi:hypothetical protein ACLKA6_014312 [Drosophila palustris]
MPKQSCLGFDTDADDDNEEDDEDDEEHEMMRTKMMVMVTKGITTSINHKPSGGDAFGIVTNPHSRICMVTMEHVKHILIK